MIPNPSQSYAREESRAEPLVAKPLRVLIDGRKLGDGGIGVYIQNLVRGLSAYKNVNCTLIVSGSQAERFDFPDNVNLVVDDAPKYSLDELLLFPRRIDFSMYDIFHAPHYMLPFGIKIPTVVTVHDLIHVTHPEKFYYPFIAKRLIRSAVSRATKVIAVSNSTRDELLKAMVNVRGLKQKLSVVPNAFNPDMICDEGDQISLRKQNELSPYFFANFSNLKPHKGFKELVESYRRMRLAWNGTSKICPTPKLVLAGQGTEELLLSNQTLQELHGLDGVHIVGRLTAGELACWYRQAKAVVVASLTEGFCLPMLEAQASGTPVLCRPVPALLELISERDLAVADFSTDALAKGMIEIVKRTVAAPLNQIPKSRLDRFSVENVAASVLEIYHQALPPKGA